MRDLAYPLQFLQSLSIAAVVGLYSLAGGAQAKTLLEVVNVEVTYAGDEFICLFGGCDENARPESAFEDWAPGAPGTFTLYQDEARTFPSDPIRYMIGVLEFDTYSFKVEGYEYTPGRWQRSNDVSYIYEFSWNGDVGSYYYEDDGYPYFRRTNISFERAPAPVPLTASSGLLASAMLVLAGIGGGRRRSARRVAVG